MRDAQRVTTARKRLADEGLRAARVAFACSSSTRLFAGVSVSGCASPSAPPARERLAVQRLRAAQVSSSARLLTKDSCPGARRPRAPPRVPSGSPPYREPATREVALTPVPF